MVRRMSPAGDDDRVQLVGAVERLVQAEALHQVGLHLEWVHIREGLLGPGEDLPHGHPPGPHVAGHRGPHGPAGDGLHRHPLDGPILVVSEAVIVIGEQIFAQGGI